MNTCFSSWLLLLMGTWIDTSSSSMDHIIQDQLPPNPCFMHECMLMFWNSVINSLQLREPTLPPASLLLSAKCHKSFSNFLLIADFFLSLLLLGFFKIDYYFGLSCSCYLCNIFHMNYYQGLLMYFILSCVLPDLQSS